MPDRVSLVSTLWLACSFALMSCVLEAPIRVSGLVPVSPQSESLLRHFSPPPGQPTTLLSASKATDAVLQVNALASEDEEQDRADPLDEPGVSFLIPSSLRKVADRPPIAPRSILSVYPLRC